MTEPAFPQDAATPQDAAPDSSSQAVVSNANRLGLQWQLRPATVNQSIPVMATYDGDGTSIAMTSMIGSVTRGQRVYAITVPPSGNFICGMPNGTFLARQTAAVAVPSFTFNQIPSTLRRLTVYWSARSSAATGIVAVRMQVNGVAGTSYTTEITTGNGATTTSALADSGAGSGFIGYAAGSIVSGGLYGTGVVNIPNWNKTSQFLGWTFENQVMASGGVSVRGGGSFNSTVATPSYISLTFTLASGSFPTGSDFQLEGVPG